MPDAQRWFSGAKRLLFFPNGGNEFSNGFLLNADIQPERKGRR